MPKDVIHRRRGGKRLRGNRRPCKREVQQAEAPRGRFLSESIALAEAHAKELGYEPTMDADFASDLREIINGRKPRDLSAWD